jgi:succinate-semialdehyde dehydrogenase/glutarate-semialdehyde dehydrogenase
MSSYNYPLFQNIRRAIPALLMGNTVLSRSSSLTPQIGMMIEELYQEAGFGNGEFLNLISSQDQTEMIICNSKIRGVAYVGSLSGGQAVGSFAGKCSKKLITENGSNDTFIVMKDADIDSAVERAMTSRLKDAGQAAISANTFLIDESVYDSFRNKLLERLQNVKMGDPMDENTMLGPLTSKDDLEKSLDQVKKAEQHGAKILCGGGRPKDASMRKALFFEPTILEITQDSPILNEETFAPIFSLMRFKDEEEIIKITNSKQLGIGTAIFTSNESRAEELASRLEVGAVFINTRTHFHTGVPIGGVKRSGIGREGGIWGTREFANVKAIFVSNDSKSGSQGAKSKPLQGIASKAEKGEMGVTAL